MREFNREEKKKRSQDYLRAFLSDIPFMCIFMGGEGERTSITKSDSHVVI